MTTTKLGSTRSRRRAGRLAAAWALVALSGLLLGAAVTAPASAGVRGHGLTARTLERAGWVCIDQEGDLPTPCLPDADVFTGEAPSSVVLTFGPEGREFWGTEHLVHHDLYNGQPCPQDEVEGGDGGYVDLQPHNGLPYFVCHHFDSPVT